MAPLRTPGLRNLRPPSFECWSFPGPQFRSHVHAGLVTRQHHPRAAFSQERHIVQGRVCESAIRMGRYRELLSALRFIVREQEALVAVRVCVRHQAAVVARSLSAWSTSGLLPSR